MSKHLTIPVTLSGQRKLEYDRSEFVRLLSKFKPGEYEITFGVVQYHKETKNRSAQQNRYYWGVIIKHAAACFSDSRGESVSPDEAHEELKRHCNPILVVRTSIKTGEVITEFVGGSTKELLTDKFDEYCARCRVWLNEWFGVYIPLPNETESDFLL